MFNICVQCLKFRHQFISLENRFIPHTSERLIHSTKPKVISNYKLVYNYPKYNIEKFPSYGSVRYFTSDKTNVLLKQNDQPESMVNKDNIVENATGDLYTGIDYTKITGDDPDKYNKFQLLLLEVEVLRQDGMRVPKVMTTENWKELFDLETRFQRRKLLAFIWLCEMKKIGDKRKKEKRKLIHLEKEKEMNLESSDGHITYGFNGSTIFIRVYDTKINAFDNNKLIQAMQFGVDMIIDCSYENDMNAMENKLCAKQLLLLFVANRLHKDPFNLHFCNFNKQGKLFKTLNKHFGHQFTEDPYYPINVHEEHYLKLFPKEKLVYLTPHCRNELKEFNSDDIYIIGGMVDRMNQDPLSLAKAKSEGLRMAQLPLDRYLDWSLGSKSLTLNQMISIMLDVRSTGDWNTAFQHIPKRKLRRVDDRTNDMKRLSKRYITKPPTPRHLRPLW